MTIQRKTKSILALIVSSVFFFQNCATLSRGTSQKIPVTSNPSGAKIIVDGEEMGYAPLELKLKRKKSHVIRIEKQGYNPLEIRTTRKTSAGLSSLGNVIWIGIGLLAVLFGRFLGTQSDGRQGLALIIGGPILGLGPLLIDFLSGANYALSPTELNVTLTKQE